MFFIFIILSLIIALAAGIYICLCTRRLLEFYGADIKKKWVKAANIIISIVLAGLCMPLFTNTAVIILHLVASFLFFDIIAYIVQRIYGKRQKGNKYHACRKIYQCGILPVLMVSIILGYGYYNMNHINVKKYEITTDKYIGGSCRILFLSDVHYGTVQDKEILKNEISSMNSYNPDIVILGGDIVEEGTSKEDMQEIFSLLGSLQNQHGIYYVYGNHDRQPYTDHRTFSDEELEQAITQNGIQILEDTYVETSNGIILAGRADATMGGHSDRLSSKKILKDADHSKYIIVADHQPIGVEENVAQGASLELSGHTHGGQIWPAGPLSEIAGVLNYGMYKRGSCKLIVSSGVAGWTYSMRTGKHCEYVIVDIKEK
jgi:hypothetical protein